MSANKEETLRQFCDVTGTDEARSRFFLESSNWQLEVALSSFYEHGGNADEAPTANQPPAASIVTLSDSDMESPPESPIRAKKEKKVANPKFGTIGSLQQESSSEDEELKRLQNIQQMTTIVQQFFCDKKTCKKKKLQMNHNGGSADLSEMSAEVHRLRTEVERLLCENCELRREIATLKGQREAGEAFYAGGSERSGQQILGPPSKGRKDIVTEMFKSVRERGAVVFEDEPSSTSRGRGGVFSGVGHRLGQTSEDPEPAPTILAAGAEGTPQQTQEQVRSVRLRLYREGFTVDGGELRHYADPDNAQFLNCIRRGEIPSELAGAGGEVRVSLEDRRHEECPRLLARAQPFTGKGQMLGSPTPAAVGAPATQGSAPDRAANTRAAQAHVQLDDALPQTTIQFRLADGSRITGRFNHSHTVADLQQYVSRAEPAYQLQSFALLTTFPSAELSDPTVTLAQANLLNTTLLQRLK